MNESRRGRIIVISGPSGVGKSSIVAAILDQTNAGFSVSATTRRARPSERDGVDYHFLTRSAFERLRDEGGVLEWAEYGGNLYGTIAEAVAPMLDAGTDVILDIENEGAKQVRAHAPDAVLIFIAPPSIDVLTERLVGRGDTDPLDIDRRLDIATSQMEEAPSLYDHIVVNDDLDAAISEVLDILRCPGEGHARASRGDTDSREPGDRSQ